MSLPRAEAPPGGMRGQKHLVLSGKSRLIWHRGNPACSAPLAWPVLADSGGEATRRLPSWSCVVDMGETEEGLECARQVGRALGERPAQFPLCGVKRAPVGGDLGRVRELRLVFPPVSSPNR